MTIRFLWDPRKATRNTREHKVSFVEAATVFQDSRARIFDDDHSEDEYREIIVGYSNRNRLLIVSYTERDNVIRIISARKADRGEHENHNKTQW